MAIAELDYDHNVFEERKADEQLAVQFYMDAIPDDEETLKNGSPKYRDVEMIEIRVRGDRNNIVRRPAHIGDQRRFRAAYENFKANKENPIVGTPLAVWPSMTKALVLELGHMGFRTVEELAGASDSVCDKVAGLRTYKQKALAFLEASKDNAVLEQMHAKLAERDNELEVLKRNHEQLLARMSVLQEKIEAKAA